MCIGTGDPLASLSVFTIFEYYLTILAVIQILYALFSLRSTNTYHPPPWTTLFDHPETINVWLPVSDSTQYTCIRFACRAYKRYVLNLSHNSNILSHTRNHSIIIIIIIWCTREFLNRTVVVEFSFFFF